MVTTICLSAQNMYMQTINYTHATITWHCFELHPKQTTMHDRWTQYEHDELTWTNDMILFSII